MKYRFFAVSALFLAVSANAHELDSLRTTVRTQMLPWLTQSWLRGSELDPKILSSACEQVLNEPRTPASSRALMVVLAEVLAETADDINSPTSPCPELSSQECFRVMTRALPELFERSYRDGLPNNWLEMIFYTQASHRREMIQIFAASMQQLLNLSDSARHELENLLSQRSPSIQELEGVLYWGRQSR